jgi:quercetin dioxygenase-like cupin family protein
MRITRHVDAPGYVARAHHGVATARLQGHEAGPTERFWAGLSYYLPGGGADESPASEETVYVVLDGALVITADGRSEEIGPLDSVHLPKGTVRRVDNRSARTATLLVIIANPVPSPAASPVASPAANPQDQPT